MGSLKLAVVSRVWVSICVALLLPAASSAQTLSGFLQIDYLNSQESTDQLNDANAEPLNQNRVLIRRVRLKLSDEWRFLEYAAEVDFNTVSGPQVGLRQMEAALVWPLREPAARVAGPHLAKPPLEAVTAVSGPDAGLADSGDAGHAEVAVEEVGDGGTPVASSPAPSPGPGFPVSFRLGAGIFRAPFGYDVYELSDVERLFAEPSMLARAFFPGQFDLGARLSAVWRGISLVLAIQNGEPIGEKSFAGRDPNDAKDFFVRATVHSKPAGWLKLDFGASTTVGTGFHAGTPATKDVIVWRDLNEDGVVQVNEIQAIRGSAATASQNFERWGVGGDVRARVALPPGELTVFGEAAIANDLDRGIRVADPVLLGRPQRSIAVFGGFTQEITRRGLVGVRVDYYEASLDQSQLQGGTLVRSREPFINYSFAAAYRFDGYQGLGRGRVLFDYTLKRDPLGRDASGRPADLRNDVFTVRLQVEL